VATFIGAGMLDRDALPSLHETRRLFDEALCASAAQSGPVDPEQRDLMRALGVS
jgi:hypothetical protein